MIQDLVIIMYKNYRKVSSILVVMNVDVCLVKTEKALVSYGFRFSYSTSSVLLTSSVYLLHAIAFLQMIIFSFLLRCSSYLE